MPHTTPLDRRLARRRDATYDCERRLRITSQTRSGVRPGAGPAGMERPRESRDLLSRASLGQRCHIRGNAVVSSSPRYLAGVGHRLPEPKILRSAASTGRSSYVRGWSAAGSRAPPSSRFGGRTDPEARPHQGGGKRAGTRRGSNSAGHVAGADQVGTAGGVGGGFARRVSGQCGDGVVEGGLLVVAGHLTEDRGDLRVVGVTSSFVGGSPVGYWHAGSVHGLTISWAGRRASSMTVNIGCSVRSVPSTRSRRASLLVSR